MFVTCNASGKILLKMLLHLAIRRSCYIAMGERG